MDQMPPPPPPPLKKKGLHPLAWAGIGCGGLVAVTAVVAAILMFTAGKELMANFKEHQGADAVATVLEMRPDLEKVSEDKEKGAITVRAKATGEAVATTYDDLILGRTLVKDPTGAPVPIGSSDLSKLPAWFVRYPGALDEVILAHHEDPKLVKGMLAFTTTDAPDDIERFFQTEAGKLLLHSTSRGEMTIGNKVSRSLKYSGPKYAIRVHIHGAAGSPWIVQVIYEENK